MTLRYGSHEGFGRERSSTCARVALGSHDPEREGLAEPVADVVERVGQDGVVRRVR
jgi:hypothetical protein